VPKITIECAETGKEIPTGIDAPTDFFAHSQPHNETDCLLAGQAECLGA